MGRLRVVLILCLLAACGSDGGKVASKASITTTTTESSTTTTTLSPTTTVASTTTTAARSTTSTTRPPTTTTTTTTRPPATTASTSTTAGAQPTAAITIQNFAFSPAALDVAAGTKVTATNRDSTGHTWTSDSGAWDSGTLTKDASSSHTFSTPGTFPYHCAIHTSMRATVTVH
jgi:plastocyanin